MSKQYPSPDEVRAFLTGGSDESPTITHALLPEATVVQQAAQEARSWFRDDEDEGAKNVVWLRAPSTGGIEHLTDAENRCPTCGLVGLCYCEDCNLCEYPYKEVTG